MQPLSATLLLALGTTNRVSSSEASSSSECARNVRQQSIHQCSEQLSAVLVVALARHSSGGHVDHRACWSMVACLAGPG